MYNLAMAPATVLRIGELSKRSGVSPELLRAWESRYGLLRPTRSPGGLRLYSADDVERVRRMQEHLASGLAAAEAAALATDDTASPLSGPAVDPAVARARLASSLDRYDEAGAQAVFDELLATVTIDTFLAQILLPYLHDLGERWKRGEASVAQEHFASSVLRGRMLALARGWGRGVGPQAVLASLPGEQHDLGLIAFGLMLRARGWRITYLGADTPLATVAEAAASVGPELIVLSATTAERVRPVRAELRRLGKRYGIGLAGPGFVDGDERALGGRVLTADPIGEAERVTADAGVHG